MKFKTDVVINQPVPKVFKYLVDAKKLTAWVDELTQYHQKTGRRSKKDSVGTLVFEDKEGVLKVKEVVKEYIPNESFVTFLSHNDMESTVSNRFIDQGSSTKIIVETHIRLKPYVANLFSIFVKKEMKSKQIADYQRLKKLLEA